jgi:hypothetical protein
LAQSPKWLDRTDDGTVLDVFEHKRETDRAVDRILIAPRKLSSGLLTHFSRAVKVNHWNDHQKVITGTDAITGEVVSIRAATASDYAENYMNKYQYPHQEDRLRRAEERFTKMDRFGAIQEGQVVVATSVRNTYSGALMFDKIDALTDDVANEFNRREAEKAVRGTPTSQPKPTPAPRRNTSWDRDDGPKMG